MYATTAVSISTPLQRYPGGEVYLTPVNYPPVHVVGVSYEDIPRFGAAPHSLFAWLRVPFSKGCVHDCYCHLYTRGLRPKASGR